MVSNNPYHVHICPWTLQYENIFQGYVAIISAIPKKNHQPTQMSSVQEASTATGRSGGSTEYAINNTRLFQPSPGTFRTLHQTQEISTANPNMVSDIPTNIDTTPKIHTTAKATIGELETRAWVTAVDRATNINSVTTQEGNIYNHFHLEFFFFVCFSSHLCQLWLIRD